MTGGVRESIRPEDVFHFSALHKDLKLLAFHNTIGDNISALSASSHNQYCLMALSDPLCNCI